MQVFGKAGESWNKKVRISHYFFLENLGVYVEVVDAISIAYPISGLTLTLIEYE